MRTIAVILMLLFTVGTVAAVVPATRSDRTLPAESSNTLQWVRTANGWEKPADWQPAPAVDPALHPALVSAFLALAGATILVASHQPQNR